MSGVLLKRAPHKRLRHLSRFPGKQAEGPNCQREALNNRLTPLFKTSAVSLLAVILIFQKVESANLEEHLNNFGFPVVVEYASLLLISGLRSDIFSRYQQNKVSWR